MKLQDGWYVFPQPNGEGDFKWEPFMIKNALLYSGWGDKGSYEATLRWIDSRRSPEEEEDLYRPVRPL